MKFLLLFIALFVNNSAIYAQNNKPYSGVPEVLRHTTEVYYMYENRVEFALNLLVEVDSDSCLLKIADIVPKSDRINVMKFQYRILNAKGKVLKKERIRKTYYSSIADFMPISAASDFIKKYERVSVEVELRIVLEGVQGEYKWPNLEGTTFAENVSMRVRWNDRAFFSMKSNIEDRAQSGELEESEYLLWQIKKLTQNVQGEFSNGEIVSNPEVRLIQNSTRAISEQ